MSKLILDKNAFKALANDTRITILKKLVSRKRTASELSKSLGVSVQAISAHLKKMRSAGLVKEEKRSKWVYYSLTEKGAGLVNPQPQKNLWILLGISLLAFSFVTPLFFGGETPAKGIATSKVNVLAESMAGGVYEETAIDTNNNNSIPYSPIIALIISSACFGAFIYARLKL